MNFAILGSRGYPSTYSGFETLVRALAPALRDAGHRVTVYGHGTNLGYRTTSYEGVRGIETFGVNTKSLATLSHGLTGSIHALKQSYDALLVVNAALGFFLPLFRAAGIPTVVNVDGIEWRRGKWGRVGRTLFYAGARLAARYATRVVADSPVIAKVWRREFSIDPVYIPYGAEVVSGLGAERIEALGLEPKKYLLVVARLVPENNVQITLDALEHLGEGVPAVVVGSANYDWELVARLRDLSKRRRNFHWLGHVDDQDLLLELWHHCAVYVHGHSAGGTNPSLLQALGCGAPTIALDTPFNKEVLGGVTDALYPAEAHELADHISRVMAAKPHSALAGDTAREVVARRFQWPAVSTQYAHLLTEAAGSA